MPRITRASTQVLTPKGTDGTFPQLWLPNHAEAREELADATDENTWIISCKRWSANGELVVWDSRGIPIGLNNNPFYKGILGIPNHLWPNQCGMMADPSHRKCWKLHPWKLTCPPKRDYFNRKYIFQPSFFRGYISFQGGRYRDLQIHSGKKGINQHVIRCTFSLLQIHNPRLCMKHFSRRC